MKAKSLSSWLGVSLIGMTLAVLMVAPVAEAKRSRERDRERNREMFERTFRKSLSEGAEMEKAFRRNSGLERSDEPLRTGRERIELEVGDELGGGGGRWRGFDRAKESEYRESNVSAKLDRELKEVESTVVAERSVDESKARPGKAKRRSSGRMKQ